MKRLALAAVLLLALALPVVAADHPLLVTPAWLAERLGRADVRIVDLSDAEDYARAISPVRCISTSRRRVRRRARASSASPRPRKAVG